MPHPASQLSAAFDASLMMFADRVAYQRAPSEHLGKSPAQQLSLPVATLLGLTGIGIGIETGIETGVGLYFSGNFCISSFAVMLND